MRFSLKLFVAVIAMFSTIAAAAPSIKFKDGSINIIQVSWPEQTQGCQINWGPAGTTSGCPYSELFIASSVGNIMIQVTPKDARGNLLWQSTVYQPMCVGCVPPDQFSLRAGNSIKSANQNYTFVYQGDGNLVLYNKAWRALWATNTHGRSVGQVRMQGDGNLVVYDASSRPIWASRTALIYRSQLVVQDDGNVVIYKEGGRAIWASNTCCNR